MYHRFHEAKLSQDVEMSHEQTQGTPPPPVPVCKVEPAPSTNSPSTSSGGGSNGGSGSTPGGVVTSGDNNSSVLISENNNASEPVVTDLTLAQAHKRTLAEFSILEREAQLAVAPLQFKIKEEEFRSSPPDLSHQQHIHSAMVKLSGKDGCHRVDHFGNLEGPPPPSYAALAQSAALDVLTSVSQGKSLLQEHVGSNPYTILSTPEVVLDEKRMKSEGSFECNVCHQCFKNAAQLKNHFWRHTGVKPFKCNICQASFTQLANLKTHQRIHTGERPFDCSECGATFTQISNLKTHQKLHTGEKPFVCDICSAKFTQQSNLKSHRLIHTGERPYKCDLCDASFVQSTHLRNHKRIHTNERPYGCEHCGASFRQLSNLKTHEKTHTGEKPFVCDECGSAFGQKSNLKAHKLKLHQIQDEPPPTRRGRKASHGGVGPFLCAECGAGFSAASNLKTHLRLHTGEKPFECTICFTSFAQKSNLRAHEMSHSDVKPFSCPDCPSTFKQKANLRTHVIKKHNGATVNFSPFLPNMMRAAHPPVSMPEGLLQFSHSMPSSSAMPHHVRAPSSASSSPDSKIFNLSEVNKSVVVSEPIVQIKEGRLPPHEAGEPRPSLLDSQFQLLLDPSRFRPMDQTKFKLT